MMELGNMSNDTFAMVGGFVFLVVVILYFIYKAEQ